jgi:hypothetical protein
VRIFFVVISLILSGCTAMIEEQKRQDALYEERFKQLLDFDPVFNRNEGMYEAIEDHERRIRELERLMQKGVRNG